MSTKAPKHAEVLQAFTQFKISGMVFVTEVVFAEASGGMTSAAQLRDALDTLGIADLSATDDGLFRAGQAFKTYKQSKGEGKKERVLADFLIGAVCETEGVALITLNGKDFIKRFPKLHVVAL